jgi:hypothetical protein
MTTVGFTPLPLDGLMASGPAPDLADKLHLFGQFVGSWACQVTSYLPDGSTQTGNGEVHFAWVLEGRAIQDVWIFPTREERRAGAPIDEYGSTMRFYDASIDAWQVIWMTPVNQRVQRMIARQVGDEIVLEGVNAKDQPLRWIFSQITSERFHWRNVVSADGGQIWRLQEEVEMRRIHQER